MSYAGSRKIFGYFLKSSLSPVLALLFLSGCFGPSEDSIQKRTKAQIGTYRLDLSKTDLGIYTKEKAKYAGLVLTMKADSTFLFSEKVPFMGDSAGKWNMGNGAFEEWDYLYYQKFDLRTYRPNVGVQFDDLMPDSTFAVVETQLNPKNPNSIYRWFKKVR